jgi:hypothetical protein
MSSLDDLTLIQRFVEGKASLEANPNLRVESSSDAIRLSTKRGAFLAAVNLALNMRSAFVRQGSQYGEVISQILVEHSFIPMGLNEQGLMRYEYYPIPQGYEMKYTEARVLWKTWRGQQLQKNTQQKLLVHTPNGWKCVQTIKTSQELLFIETLADEVMIHSTDRIAWLSAAVEEPKTQIFAYKPLAQPEPPAPSSESSHYFSGVVQMKDGKLYIQTPQGEVVVEGSDLRFYLANAAQNAAQNVTQNAACVRSPDLVGCVQS